MDTELAAAGRRVNGPIEQPHVTPWSTAMRIPTAGGLVWFKASGPGTAHEGPLLETFRRLDVARVVLPFAVHATRPWLLFDDAGPTLRAASPDGLGDHDLAAWRRILPEYATLQRSVESVVAVAAMERAGVPDGRPATLARELDRLLGDDRVWGLVPAEDRAAATRARATLRESERRIREGVARLDSAGVTYTIQHDDLHGGNVVVGAAGDRFFDWGDAVIAHPFATLNVTFNSIAHRTARDLGDPAFDELRDAYLEAWTDVARRDVLLNAAGLARDLGCIGRALAWERALLDLAPDEMDGHGDAIAGWLVELGERLDGPVWQP